MGYWKTVIVNDYDAKGKISFLLREAVNVLFTGTLIWYAIEHRNIVSYGILASLSTYYFSLIVSIIRDAVKSK